MISCLGLAIRDRTFNSFVVGCRSDGFQPALCVVAVRDLTEKDALVKPASKLVNAWIAGVPALLAPEPAFREQRQSNLDYIEVTTPQAVFDTVKLLKSQPELYQQMVANGLKRAEVESKIATVFSNKL